MKARARCASVPWELMLQKGAGEGEGGESKNMLMPAMAAGVRAACLQQHAVAVEVESGSLFSGVMNAAPANQACVYM
jgi:hypothetical protein